MIPLGEFSLISHTFQSAYVVVTSPNMLKMLLHLVFPKYLSSKIMKEIVLCTIERKILLALLGTSPLWLSILFLLYGPSFAIQKSINRDKSFKIVGVSPSKEKKESLYASSEFWNQEDMQKLQLPVEIETKAEKIKVIENTIKIGNVEVFYREALTLNSPNTFVTVLLLHGMAFSSKTWLELGTLRLIAAMGYRTIAADIPGYGNSPPSKIDDDFVYKLILSLKLYHVVVISPSMSGTYTIPYLVNHFEEMGGYVPVAPQGWGVLQKQTKCGNGDKANIANVPEELKSLLPDDIPNLSCIKVPTLVVYGEHDRKLNSALLCLLPWSQPFEIPDGKHPAYLSNPVLWHQILYNFLGHTVKRIESQG